MISISRALLLGFLMLLGASTARAQCAADFTMDVSCDTLRVVDSSTWNGASVKRFWSFGDSSQGIGPDYRKEYDQAGRYVVTLRIEVFDNAQRMICVDSVSKSVTIVKTCCKADFVYYSVGLYAAFFDDSRTKNARSIMFDYGDNSTGTSQRHTYQRPGTYQVCMTIFDSIANCSDSVCKTIEVESRTCDPSFTHWIDTNNRTINLYRDQPHFEYGEYQMGDGSRTPLDDTVQYQYDSAGTYTIRLRIFKQLDSIRINCDTSITVVIPRVPKSCRSDWTFSTNKFEVTFEATNKNGTSYHWYLGDADSAKGPRTVHTYATTQTQTYAVCLTVFDSTINCSTTTCGSVTVPDSCYLNSDFSMTLDTVRAYVNFNPVERNTKVEHKWIIMELGDTVYGPTQGYQFYGPESFTIMHVVVYPDSSRWRGCSDTTIDMLTIPQSPACYAQFKTAVDTNQKFKIYIVNQSLGDSLEYLWNMGDGTEYTTPTPKHRYQTFGRYLVTLRVKNSKCEASVSHYLGMDSTGKLLKADGFDVEVIDRSVIGVPKKPRSEEFLIFPNPFTEEINIRTWGDWSSLNQGNLRLYDINGKVVELTSISTADGLQINTAQLAKGIYILRLELNGMVLNSKLIKN